MGLYHSQSVEAVPVCTAKTPHMQLYLGLGILAGDRGHSPGFPPR